MNKLTIIILLLLGTQSNAQLKVYAGGNSL